jgi:hypothetical protein
MAALQPFRELSERLPLSIVTAFLGVALKEGRTLGEYATEAGFSLSVASRLFADLGSINRWGEPGFGLSDTRPDGRATTTKLTPVGSALVGGLLGRWSIGARHCDDNFTYVICPMPVSSLLHISTERNPARRVWA